MSSKRKGMFGILMLMAACGFLIYGAARGEIAVVFHKAVNICLECIGLG